MTAEILTRIVWAAALILAGWALYQLVSRISLRRASGLSAQSEPSGSPSIVYFTTPDCVPCKTVQRPAILKIQQALGQQLAVVEINAYEQPDLARQWGVLSVPTTFILDRSGKAVHVNHGVTRAEKLLSQIQAIL